MLDNISSSQEVLQYHMVAPKRGHFDYSLTHSLLRLTSWGS